jgi:hypothetical protein
MSNHGILYAYEPLSKDTDEIRLLRLMPPSASGDIEIEIINVTFSTLPAYAALSHVWGSPERTQRTTVQTHSHAFRKLSTSKSAFEEMNVPVRPIQLNYLAITLHHLRLAKESRLL